MFCCTFEGYESIVASGSYLALLCFARAARSKKKKNTLQASILNGFVGDSVWLWFGRSGALTLIVNNNGFATTLGDRYDVQPDDFLWIVGDTYHFWRMSLIKALILLTATITFEGCPWSNQWFEWSWLSFLKDSFDKINESNDRNYHFLRMSLIKSMNLITWAVTFEGYPS
jgi:hypothetical protein